MRIPKYWAQGEASGVDQKGKKVSFTCWHWSEKSFEEAKSLAHARAAGLLNRVVIGDLSSLEQYPYGVRPMREEIIERVIGRHGEEAAIITRNGYGALVLNAARAMFMDIDLGEAPKKKSGPGFFARLFGTKKPPQDVGVFAEPGMEAVERWAELHRDLSLRVYRTRAGLRCLITSHTFDPADPKVEAMMKELDCDPLYIRLCRSQQCFRARLTPKPWRCGSDRPPSTFPFADQRAEKRYRRWEEDYRRACQGYDVCRLLATIGSQVHPEVTPVLELHDRHCCVGDGRDLA